MKQAIKHLFVFSIIVSIIATAYSCSKSTVGGTGGTWVAKQTTYTATSTSRSGNSIIFTDGTHHTTITCTFFGNIPTAAGSYRIAYTAQQYGEVAIVYNDGGIDYHLDYYAMNMVPVTIDANGKLTLVIPSVEAATNTTPIDTLTIYGTVHEI